MNKRGLVWNSWTLAYALVVLMLFLEILFLNYISSLNG